MDERLRKNADSWTGSGYSNKSNENIFGGMENNPTYQAMVEALNDTILRVKIAT
jgi:hypothetical protein